MAKSLKQVLDQINKLQRQAEEIRNKEVSEVVSRIRVAIDHYGLTAQDLFESQPRGTSRRGAPPRGRAATRKRAGDPKYASGDGRTWTGTGKRPTWFVEALAAGKTAQDLLIDPSVASAASSPHALVASEGPSKKRARRTSTKVAKAPKSAKPGKTRTARTDAAAATPRKTRGMPKYHDGAGRTWTGVGKRPSWFVEALAAGQTAEQLLIPKE